MNLQYSQVQQVSDAPEGTAVSDTRSICEQMAQDTAADMPRGRRPQCSKEVWNEDRVLKTRANETWSQPSTVPLHLFSFVL